MSTQPKLLYNQQSLIDVTFYDTFEETWLPNLTQVVAFPSLLRVLIPGRPVREIIVLALLPLMFFTLSTAPIQKLGTQNLDHIYPYVSLLFVWKWTVPQLGQYVLPPLSLSI